MLWSFSVTLTDASSLFEAGIDLEDRQLIENDVQLIETMLSSSSPPVIRRTWLSTVGDGAFPVPNSHLWNSLPPDVTSAPTLAVFRKRLKTYIFPVHFHQNQEILLSNLFYYRATICDATHGIAVAILSVRRSVRQMRVL